MCCKLGTRAKGLASFTGLVHSYSQAFSLLWIVTALDTQNSPLTAGVGFLSGVNVRTHVSFSAFSHSLYLGDSSPRKSSGLQDECQQTSPQWIF